MGKQEKSAREVFTRIFSQMIRKREQEMDEGKLDEVLCTDIISLIVDSRYIESVWFLTFTSFIIN